MNNNPTPAALRVAAIAAAVALTLVVCFVVLALALTNNLTANGGTVATLIAMLVAAVPSLLTFATAQKVHEATQTIRGLVNGNYQQALQALGAIAAVNPDRRSTDIAAQSAAVMSPPPAGPETGGALG